MILDQSGESRAMQRALAELADNDGKPVGRIYRSRRRYWTTLLVMSVVGVFVGVVAGLVATTALVSILLLMAAVV